MAGFEVSINGRIWASTEANAALRGKIEELCRAAGFEPPTICTPLELPKE